MKTLTLGTALLLTLALAACGEEQPPGAGGDLIGVSWLLTGGSVDGAALTPIADAPVTLAFQEDGTAGGTAACNGYGGAVTVSGGNLAFPEGFMQTQMWCEGSMDLESSFLGALARATAFQATTDLLVLTGAGVELRFAPQPEEPDAALEGTLWVLETLIAGETASTPAAEATIEFAVDGGVSGTTGCNSYFGSYDTATGFSAIGSTKMACEEPIMDQETRFLAVLADHATVTIEGSRLTITDLSGNALEFRAG